MLAVLDRSQAVGFFEHSDEVTVIRKPDFLDDAFDGHVGAGQISAGAVKAHNVKVLGNGFAGVLFENAADVGLVVRQVFHQFFYAALNKAAAKTLSATWGRRSGRRGFYGYRTNS